VSDSHEVISGILEQAKAEAQKIRDDASSTAKVRRQALSTRVERIHSESDDRAEAEIQRIERRYRAARQVEERRARLRLEQKVYSDVLDGVRKRLEALVAQPEYDEILKGWIAEAAIGLGCTEAQIRVSAAETACAERVLPDAESTAASILGISCSLSLDKGHPLRQQGVVAVSLDGSTAFNNQLDTRLARYEPQLRAIVTEEVLEPEH
jgi:vacuolar-type H+-ATPase subunit E/Vma4